MNIQESLSCRGDGKIYLGLRFDGFDQTAVDSFGVALETDSGEQLPVNVVRCPELDAIDGIAVLPMLEVAQNLKVSAFGKDGAVLAEFRKRTTPASAKWTSRMNGLLGKGACEKIRNYDDRRSFETPQIDVYECVEEEGDGCLILHGCATASHRLENAYEFSVLNSKGQRLPNARLIRMQEKLRMFDDSDVSLFETQFSLTIPAGSEGCCIWLHPFEESLSSGFAVLEDAKIAALRDSWNALTRSADRDSRYEDWFLGTHRAKPDELELQRRARFADEPLFSIIVPLFNTRLDFLRDMAESVIAQTYPNFELLLVNASPDNEELKAAAQRLADSDKRVHHILLDANKGITENTNEGIKKAHGDFLCFLDHDDTIEPNVLFEYASAINRYPRTDLLYCDEDKLVDGGYAYPYFKPDFNLDLLRGINYICHFLTVRKSVLDALDLPTSIYDGAQDYHMTFRIAEAGGNVFHARKVLYHWRIHEHSTAGDAEEKPYTMEAARLCVQHHLERCGIDAEAVNSQRVPRNYEVKYRLRENPLVSIIIPTKDNKRVLETCIDSIFGKSTYANYEIIVVENNSVEPETFAYYEKIDADPRVSIVTWEEEFNFSALMNFGARHARGEFFILLNNDTEVISHDWIERMLGPCSRSDVGMVGARLLFSDGTVQHAGVLVDAGAGPGHLNYKLPRTRPGYFNTAVLTQDLSAVTAACLMVKASVFQELDGFDESFVVDYNDIDFCLRARELGYLVVYEAGAELHHHESVSRGPRQTDAQKIRFCKEQGLFRQRWAKYFAKGDPYYNPNLVNNGYYGLKTD